METGFLNQRVAVLVDEMNICLTGKEIHKRSVNYEKMLGKVDHRQIIRAIAYCIDFGKAEKCTFIKKLGYLNFEVKSKPVKVFADGQKKGDWDMGIAIDAVSLAEKVDVITLVACDSDYIPLVYYLKSRGVRVEVMGFPERISKDLVNSADKFIPITKDMMMENA